MKAKRLILLVNVLLLLVVLAFVKKFWMEKHEANIARESAPKSDILSREVTPAFVSKLEITNGTSADGKITLEKSGDNWTLPSHYGTRGAKWSIDDVLKNLSLLEGELRSESPDVLSDYELGDEQAIHVRVGDSGGTEILHLLVSPQRPYGTQNFVRVADSPRVFMTETDILGALGIYTKGGKPDYKTFAHQQALKADISKVTGIRLTTLGGSILSLAKKTKEDGSASWEFDPKDASEIDPAKVNEFLGLALNLYGVEVLDPAGDNGYGSKPLVSLTQDDGGKSVTMDLFVGKVSEANKDQTAIRTMPDNMAWNTRITSVEGLKKDKAFFLKAKPAA